MPKFAWHDKASLCLRLNVYFHKELFCQHWPWHMVLEISPCFYYSRRGEASRPITLFPCLSTLSGWLIAKLWVKGGGYHTNLPSSATWQSTKFQCCPFVIHSNRLCISWEKSKVLPPQSAYIFLPSATSSSLSALTPSQSGLRSPLSSELCSTSLLVSQWTRTRGWTCASWPNFRWRADAKRSGTSGSMVLLVEM